MLLTQEKQPCDTPLSLMLSAHPLAERTPKRDITGTSELMTSPVIL
jgi:hypothetical protein